MINLTLYAMLGPIKKLITVVLKYCCDCAVSIKAAHINCKPLLNYAFIRHIRRIQMALAFSLISFSK